VRFAFLADMQLGAYASFSGLSNSDVADYAANKDMRVRVAPRVEGFEWDARRYRLAVAEINAVRPDLVVIGGDMVDDPNSEDQYDEFMGITNAIDGDIPVRWVPGNHDVAADTLVPTRESIARYRDAFGPDFFAFDQGDLRFIALNTVVIDHPEEVPGEWEAQRDFLASELIDADDRHRTVVLLGHHPLFTRHADEQDDYWNLPIERRRIVLDLIRCHRVPMALAGHWHRNGNARDGDFEMVITGPVGYPLGDDPSGFRLIDHQDDALSHSYRQIDP